MKIETERLLTVKSYADFKKVSTTAVYAWIAQGKVNCMKINEVQFIQLEKEEYEAYKKTKDET